MESKELKKLDRMHLLSTVVEYPGLPTQEVRDRANNEAQHDVFDPVPFATPQGITGKLNSMSRDGLLDGWPSPEGMRWEATVKGKHALKVFFAELEVAEAQARLAAAVSTTERS